MVNGSDPGYIHKHQLPLDKRAEGGARMRDQIQSEMR